MVEIYRRCVMLWIIPRMFWKTLTVFRVCFYSPYKKKKEMAKRKLGDCREIAPPLRRNGVTRVKVMSPGRGPEPQAIDVYDGKKNCFKL